MSESVPFEIRMARLEEIAARLDREDLELEVALALFDEGVEVLRAAASELRIAEEKVKVLVERLDGTFDLRDHAG
jgi:exodeoxyribonuclease VII small subunit